MTCRLLWLLIDGMQGKLEGWNAIYVDACQ